MNSEIINALGLSPAQLQEIIVSRAVEALLRENDIDEDGDETERPTDLSERVSKMVKARIDAKVNELADKFLMPKIDAHIDELVLQETTKWGEKVGAPMTVIQYLVRRAEAYMVEPVNYQGKTQAEDSYSWKQHSTRLTYAINNHLQYEIKGAMEQALKDANTTIARGLHESCRVAINEAAAKFKIAAVGS